MAETVVFEIKVESPRSNAAAVDDVDDSISSLEKSFQDLQKRAQLTADDLQNAAVEGAQAASQATQQVGQNASAGADSMQELQRRANLAAVDLGRIAQDAPYGLIGIANNIEPAVQSIQRLRMAASEAGTSALPALIKGLTGPTGIAVAAITAMSIFESQIPKIQRFFGAQRRGAQEAQEAYGELFEVVRTGAQLEGVELGIDQTERLAEALDEVSEVMEGTALNNGIDDVESKFSLLFDALNKFGTERTLTANYFRNVILPQIEGLTDRSDVLREVFAGLGVDVEALTAEGADFEQQWEQIAPTLLENESALTNLSGQLEKVRQALQEQIQGASEDTIVDRLTRSVLDAEDVLESVTQQFDDLVARQQRVSEVIDVDRVDQLEERASFLRDALESIATQDLDVSDAGIAQLQGQLAEVNDEIARLQRPDGPGLPELEAITDQLREAEDLDTTSLDQMLDAMGALQLDLANIQDATSAGILSGEEADQRRVQAAQQALQRLQREALQGEAVDADDVQEARRVLQRFQAETEQDMEQGTQSAFAQGIAQGAARGFQAGFQPLLQDIESDVAKALINAMLQALSSAVAKQLADLLGGDGEGGEGEGLAGQLLGGVIGTGLSLITGGLFADGGRPPIGKVSVVGERGPELFVPDEAGTVLPNAILNPPAFLPAGSAGGSAGGRASGGDAGGMVREVRRLADEVARIKQNPSPTIVSRRDSRRITDASRDLTQSRRDSPPRPNG